MRLRKGLGRRLNDCTAEPGLGGFCVDPNSASPAGKAGALGARGQPQLAVTSTDHQGEQKTDLKAAGIWRAHGESDWKA